MFNTEFKIERYLMNISEPIGYRIPYIGLPGRPKGSKRCCKIAKVSRRKNRNK